MIYPGNKAVKPLAANIINIFPPHTFYWELCYGTGGISKIKHPAKFNVGIEKDPKVIERFKNEYPASMVVINDCAISWSEILIHCPQSHLIFADPPYPKSSRRSQIDIYDFEWTDEQHKVFLTNLIKCTCYVVISSYENDLYNSMLSGWNKKKMKVSVHGKIATEIIYFNFSLENGKKHEYKFTGKNKTHRQQVKRKAQRWIDRLMLQDPDVRECIFEYMKRRHGS